MKASHSSRCLKIRHACTDFLARFRTFHAQTTKQYTEKPAINELIFPQSNNVSFSNLSDLSYTERQNWICWCRFKCCCSEPFSLIAYTSLQHKLQGQGWHFRDIISNQHGHHVCPLKCYSQHKCIKKTEAHSFDRPYFPSTVFQGQGCQSEIIQTNRLLPSQASSMFIKQEFWTQKDKRIRCGIILSPVFPSNGFFKSQGWHCDNLVKPFPTKTSISYVI